MNTLSTAPARVLGFDVAKDIIIVADGQGAPRRLANRRAAIGSFLQSHCGGDSVLLVCEATGGHEALLLAEALRAGLPCHRADTVKVKAFIRSFGTIAKTDAIDAAGLCAYGRERWARLKLWTAPDADATRLARLVRRRRQLVDTKVAEQNRAKAPGAGDLAASFRDVARVLERQIKALDQHIDALLAASTALSERLAVARRLPGIGRITAVSLIALMPELGTLTRRQAAALAGLAPHPNDSGKTSRYRRMRGGRPELRNLLFLPALSAARAKGRFSAFYKRLIENGKKPIVAVAAVMRKIIVTLNARLRDHAAAP